MPNAPMYVTAMPIFLGFRKTNEIFAEENRHHATATMKSEYAVRRKTL